MAKHRITDQKWSRDTAVKIDENFRELSTQLGLENFSGGVIDTTKAGGNVTINKNFIEVTNIITGKQELVVSPGDDIQEKIDSLTSGGIVSLRNGLYTVTDDIIIPSGVYVHGETSEGVYLDFVDNTHGIKAIGDNVYTTGTVSINPGDTTVTGSGTEWLTYAAAGQYILLGQSWSLITEVVSDTELTIELPFGWEIISGGTYTIASIVQGVEFRNATILNADNAIDFEYAYNFTISGIITSLCNKGIYLNTVSSYDITNSYNLYDGISVDITNAHLMKGDNFYSLGAQVSHGIQIDTIENSKIDNCVSAGNYSDGVHITNSKNFVLNGTLIQNGNDAIYMENCNEVVFDNTATESNVANGVETVNCNNITLKTVASNGNGGNGLTLIGTSDLEVVGGYYTENYGYGISIDGDSSDNIISSSVVMNNLTDELSDLGTNTVKIGNIGITNSYTDLSEFTGTLDDITDGTTYVKSENNYDDTAVSKLGGIEAGAEVNNISDVNATDLTDGGATTLHKHDHGNLDGLSDDDHTQYLLKSTYDADSVVTATTDNTPIVTTLAEQTVLGRLTGGHPDDIAIGIADNNIVQIDAADVADNEYARFTANGLESRSTAEVLSDIGAAPALGADDNYVTDAEKVVIGNTSGVNTGDQDLSGLLPKATNVTSINDTGIADGEIAIFNKTNKDIRTSDKTIVTTIGADDTTIPTSKAVADAITAGGGYTDEMAQDAVGAMIADTTTIDLTYTDATPELKADVKTGSVANPLLANMAQNTIKGRVTASTGAPEDLSAANVRTIINVEDGADVTDATNVNAAGAVMESDTSTASMSFVIDEDNMASDLATKVPTQQSVKAYVDSQSGGLSWNEVTGTTQNASVNNGYITNNASLVTVYSPASPSIGDIVRIVGKGAGGWTYSLEPGTTVYFGNTSTSAGGSLSSTNIGDCIELVCITANTGWRVVSSIGNITVA